MSRAGRDCFRTIGRLLGSRVTAWKTRSSVASSRSSHRPLSGSAGSSTIRSQSARANIASGFDFLWNRGRLRHLQTLIPYTRGHLRPRLPRRPAQYAARRHCRHRVRDRSSASSLGIARLSKNWLVAEIATVYVETLRNIPVLLQLFFWYRRCSAVPGPRQAINLPFDSSCSNRGLLLPNPSSAGEGFVAIAVASLGIVVRRRRVDWARRRADGDGTAVPDVLVGLAIIVWPAAPRLFLHRRAADARVSGAHGFNFVGGFHILPGVHRAGARRSRSIPRPSSPRSSAPASCRSAAARPRPPTRSGCARADAPPGDHPAGACA